MIEKESVAELVRLLRQKAPSGACLCIDSRQIRSGDIFVAVMGVHADGLSFAQAARDKGASLIVTSRRDTPPVIDGIDCIEVDGLDAQLGEIAAAFYDDPSAHMRGIVITGTNGKTSTSHWISRLLTQLHHPCAAMGTMGCHFMGTKLSAPCLTTPDAASLQQLFAQLYAKGCQSFALEASSIGLEQGRLAGTAIHTAVFTNLTRDHLDYHGTMRAYEEAKKRLFEWPDLRCAVINAEDEAGCRMINCARSRGIRVIAYSTDEGNGISGVECLLATHISANSHGMHFVAHWKDIDYPVDVGVFGRFNVENLLAVAGAALSLGIAPASVFAQLQSVQPPAGRMQTVDSQAGPLIVVDFAHTPDAIEKTLEALRETAQERQGQVWIVFGAGGDRDHGKRALMGASAARLADHVIITSDNPRSENPADIMAMVAHGARHSRHMQQIQNRAQAIAYAVAEAREEDIVLIAGKGHEDYQEIQGVKHHFSDMEQARDAAQRRSHKEQN